MYKNLILLGLGLLIIGLTGCNIKTPEIKGVVLDAETKQSVEGAWVTATLEVYSKTVAGDVHQSLFVGKTWTDKNGRFVIPSKEFKKPSFPVSFGIKVDSVNVAARAADVKSGGIGIKELNDLREVNINIGYPKDELDYHSELEYLYTYIETGRVGISVPPVSESERKEILNLAIEAYEKYLEKYKNIKTAEEIGRYSGKMQKLGYLYKKRGDYRKALETFKKVKEFDERHGMTLWKREYEIQINELQQKIKGK
jgi:tetratricopeptide (TPR) repeat protein